MYGDFSLFQNFKSYCEIKRKSTIRSNLKQWGTFGDFEFIIYTNQKMWGNFPLQGGDTDPLSILSSGTDCGKYITFDETFYKDIFGFFEELSGYHKHIRELEDHLKERNSVHNSIKEMIKKVQNCVKNEKIKQELKDMETKVNIHIETPCIAEMVQCDFTLYKEFLNKVKIFHSQSNEESLKGLIGKEIQ